MKKSVTHLIVGLIVSISIFGCTDLEEEPIGLLAPESFFKSPQDAEAAVLGSYSMLTRDYLYGRVLPMSLQLRGDLVDIGDIGTSASRIQTNDFIPDANNGDYADIWSSLYLVAGSANAAIDNIPEIEMDENEKNALIGEARMVRALAYYHLVQMFGDVPYIGEFVNDPDAYKELPRTPVEEVWSHIIEDVTYATTVLPDTYPGNARSRATRGTAHTFLSKIYLVRKDWQQAAEHAEIVINDAGSFGYSLVPDYQDLWNANSGDLSEHIWTADFLGGVNDYSNDNRANVDYNAAMTGVRDADMQGWSVTVASPGVYDFFPSEDYRKDVSFITETPVDGEMTPYTEWTWPRIHIGKWAANPGEGAQSSGAQSDHNYVIFRYAEVLLIAAEALNEANGGPTPQAYEYINRVRQRARNHGGTASDVPADLQQNLSQEAFRQAVRDERVYELAFEWKRWYDLKRWGVVNEAFTRPNSFEPHPEVANFMELFPVPQAEIDRNENLLPQNSGY